MSDESRPVAPPSTPLPASSGDGWPWHPGEQAAQRRAGVRERLEQSGRRVLRDFMPDQHRELFGKLPYLFVGSLDRRCRPWASMLVGRAGFVSTPDARTMRIAARPLAADPAAGNMDAGAAVGILGIELETRRRNRMNGVVVAAGSDGLTVSVRQSFGNCAKYIQARTAIPGPAAPVTVVATRETAVLSPEAADLIRGADTFFIATAAPEEPGDSAWRGPDVSHRGGRPGFVRVSEEGGATVLTAPDFAGNLFFMTLGNLLLTPRAGLLFVDFRAGHLLSLTGAAEVIWEGPELAAFAGAERLLRLRVEEGVLLRHAVPIRWSAAEPAPQLASTRTWVEAARPAPLAGVAVGGAGL